MQLILSILLAALTLAGTPDDPEKARRGVFALTNARIETVTGGVIERGTLVIEGGRIAALGPDVDVPAGAEVIDCTGLTVYPGLVDAGTRLGLSEITSVGETNDYRETGDLTPQMDALVAVNPNSVHVAVTRVSGVTTVLTAPSGGLLPGSAALIDLHGYTPEQMLVDEHARAMVLEFPVRGGGGSAEQRAEDEKAYRKAMDRLDETWERARLYGRIDSAYAANPTPERRPEYVPEMRALLPVLRGEMPLLIEVDRAEDIRAALAWVERQGLDRVILGGVAEGWRVADEIAAAGLPCLVGPVLAVPARASDRYDRAYANPALLHGAGVKIALRTGEAENVRNLPYHAGFAAAYGLGREAALRAVTISPAEIFGTSDETGSLEVGKRATLFVADGDPFEPATQVRRLFIEGYDVPLESRQIRLYEEFLDREPGLEAREGATGEIP